VLSSSTSARRPIRSISRELLNYRPGSAAHEPGLAASGEELAQRRKGPFQRPSVLLRGFVERWAVTGSNLRPPACKAG